MISSYNFVNLKIGSLNCRGLNDRLKRMAIFDQIRNSDLTIVMLQETKLCPENEMRYQSEWDKGPSFFNSIKGGKSGTAILFNTKQVEIQNMFRNQIGRTICIDVVVNGTVLYVLNTYFPNKGSEQYSYIHSLQPFFYSPHPVIWAGDHNISTNNRVDRLPVNNSKDTFGDNVLEIIENFDLVDTCRIIYPSGKNIFTYTQGKSRSRIDKIIVHNSFRVCNYEQMFILHSDHELISTQLQLNVFSERGKGVWKNNISIYQSESFIPEFEALWYVWKLTTINQCPIKFWVQVKQKIKCFLIDIGKNLARLKKEKKKSDYQRLESLLSRATVSSDIIDQTQLMNDYLSLKKTLAKNELDLVKEKMELKKCREILDGEKPTKCFFQRFRRTDLKGKKNNGLYDNDGILKERLADILSIASDFYCDLYQNKEIDDFLLNSQSHMIN